MQTGRYFRITSYSLQKVDEIQDNIHITILCFTSQNPLESGSLDRPASSKDQAAHFCNIEHNKTATSVAENHANFDWNP